MADEDPGFLTHLSRAVVWLSLVVFLTGLAAAGYFAWRLSRDTAETFADPVDQFKYGSTGGDRNFGIPYAMWEAMPTLFRDLMPEGREDEGWAAFGFLYEDPADLPPELRHPRPVGTSLRNNLGIDRIFLNCAGCHAGSVRTGPGGEQLIIAGMPSNTVDLSAFQGFLARAAVDERFSADRFLSEIDARGIELDLVNRFALKFVGIGMARERLLAIVDRFDDFVHNEPTFGPGRFDTFNPAKALLNWEFDRDPREPSASASSISPPSSCRAPRRGCSSTGTATTPRSPSATAPPPSAPAPPRPSSTAPRSSAWRTGSPPPSPRPSPTSSPPSSTPPSRTKARRSTPANAPPATAPRAATSPASTWARSPPSPRSAPTAPASTTTPTTSRSTRTASTPSSAPERFQTFRKTNGYANAPLDGLWLRAPYLHNGSVPTLAALLSPPDERPAAFLRGHDVYDPQAMGFESDPARIDPAIQPHLFCYVTRAGADALCPAEVPPMNGTCDAGICRGNGNGGHLWGTDLDPADKRALIEHLKTF